MSARVEPKARANIRLRATTKREIDEVARRQDRNVADVVELAWTLARRQLLAAPPHPGAKP